MLDHLGTRSTLVCPDCNGTMWQIEEGQLVRYRCHVGHTYASEMMSVAVDESFRRALASALRALEDRVTLTWKLHQQETEQKQTFLAKNWAEKAVEYQREMDVIRNALMRAEGITAASAVE